jgi:hypothetical protein
VQPFEYWITYDEDPEYQNIMDNIEKFIETPGEKDIPVNRVFTDKMFDSLEKRMDAISWPSVRSYWEKDYSTRLIISGFLKNKELGSKRLASMPDRFTNTINVAGSAEPVCRPTVINMYDGDLSTTDMWYTNWEKFMFDDALTIKGKDGEMTKKPYELLKKIPKVKYPDITEVRSSSPSLCTYRTTVFF